MKLGQIYKGKEQGRRVQLHRRMGWQSIVQIIQGFVKRKISAKVACQWLEISRSRLYELRERWITSLPQERLNPSWLIQRKASSRFSLEVQTFLKEEFKYIKEQSKFFRGHYNFAVLAQQCAKRFGKRFQRSTIRRWAIRERFYDPKTDSTSKVYVRFEMGAIGYLWQHDSSQHVWLPLTGRYASLILTEDDHSRKVVGGLLVPQESAWHHLCVVRKSIEMYGLPLAYYLDNHSIFKPRTEPQTQFSRALSAVGISLKFTAKAHPQAKGKIEKRFDYFQRRIPYLCERYNITSLTQANKILQEEIAYYNHYHIHAETQETPEKRWQKALEEKRSILKPIPKQLNLDLIFALHYPRAVKGDGTISFAGKFWKVHNGPRHQKVTVVLKPPTSARKPYTEIFVLHKGSTLAHFVLSKTKYSV